jgi:hypothetical protein
MVTGTFLCLCNGSSIVIFKKSLCLFDGNDVTDTILFASITVMKLPLHDAVKCPLPAYAWKGYCFIAKKSAFCGR